MQDNDPYAPATNTAAENLAAMQSITRQRLADAQHAIGDRVNVQATVVGVNFSIGKVRYVVKAGENVSIVDSCDVQRAAEVAP